MRPLSCHRVIELCQRDSATTRQRDKTQGDNTTTRLRDNAIKQVENTKSIHEIPISKLCVQVGMF